MTAAKKSVYVETSVLSFLCAEPSTVQITLEKQRDTRVWWETRLPEFDACVSDEVMIEASPGDHRFARRRLERAAELRLVETLPSDQLPGRELIVRRILPSIAGVDAVHLAIAGLLKIDILLTWNLKHLANPQVLSLVYNFLSLTRRHMPAITTPSALLEST